jgi:CDGSH-type Zn-finger protein
MSSGDQDKKPAVEIGKNASIKVTGLENFYNSRGEKIETRPTTFLCRCGASENKPCCDGRHTRIGFTGEKSEDRVRERWKDYVGEKIIVRDNRGICSHSGICVNELRPVFDKNRRPWIRPDSAEVAAVIDIVRRCPSGALRYLVDGVEHKDFDNEPAIHIEKNGPLNVAGGIEFKDPDGYEPASKEHYSLCRCGASKNKPFCDGSHSRIKFRDEKN